MGDSGAIVQEGRVGVVLRSLDSETFDTVLPEIRTVLSDARIRERCRGVATEFFDLQTGIDRYSRLYRRLATRT